MTYDFFASIDDQVQILEFIFSSSDLHVYELSSSPEKEIQEFKDVSSVVSYLKTQNRSAYFQLWSPDFSCKPTFRRVDLNPKYCNGHTFRYATDGVGLIQLYLGVSNEKLLVKSHVGHFEERGAIARFGSEATLWNWPNIRAISGKIKRVVQQMAVDQQNGRDVLKGASELYNLQFTI